MDPADVMIMPFDASGGPNTGNSIFLSVSSLINPGAQGPDASLGYVVAPPGRQLARARQPPVHGPRQWSDGNLPAGP